jgi:NADPH2:quinone reductase
VRQRGRGLVGGEPGGGGGGLGLDPIGGAFSEPALRSLGPEGRHLVVGFAAGTIPRLPLNLVLLKSCAVLGVNFSAFVRNHPDDFRHNLRQLLTWCAAGQISAHVHAVYPLAETAKALHTLADRSAMGKVIVTP